MIRVRVVRDGRQMEGADLAVLGREFGVHEIALEDLEVGERQGPKVEQYPDQDQVLLVWYGARRARPSGRPGCGRSTSSPARTT